MCPGTLRSQFPFNSVELIFFPLTSFFLSVGRQLADPSLEWLFTSFAYGTHSHDSACNMSRSPAARKSYWYGWRTSVLLTFTVFSFTLLCGYTSNMLQMPLLFCFSTRSLLICIHDSEFSHVCLLTSLVSFPLQLRIIDWPMLPLQ